MNDQDQQLQSEVPPEPTPVADLNVLADTGAIDEIDLDKLPQPEDTPTDPTDTNTTNTTNEAGVGTDEVDDNTGFSWPAPEANNNATIETAYYRELGDKFDDLAAIIALPPDTSARSLNYVAQNPNAESQVKNEAGLDWAQIVEDGLQNGSYHDNMLAATRREGADFRQAVVVDADRLNIAAPRFGAGDGPLLSGERAMLQVSALLGRGAIMQIPLWHSGFWLTIKQPSEIDLLDALQRISDTKVTFGRSTNGLAFANHVSVTNAAIVDLAMRNIFECTVEGFTAGTPTKIREHISCLDIPTIAWGLAAAVYPKGFQFERALLDSKGLQTNVVRELLNIGTCIYTDRNSLNDWQVRHMAKRGTGRMKEHELSIYQSHFARGKSKTVELDKEVLITLRVPNVDEFLMAGQRWLDELTNSVHAAFAQDLTDEQRNELIIDRAKATSMRQYVHWIEKIELPSKKASIVDFDTLDMTVGRISGDDTIRDRYYKIIQEFINDSVVTMIGVPQVHKDEAVMQRPRFENIIPLDPIAVFFNLLYQKILQIRRRP